METNKRAMVLASFAGDAHALGPHWIYDPGRIEEAFGRVETLQAPLPGSFHAPKGAGAFTHYGDQTLVLLESLAEREGFHLDDFWQRWQDFFSSYNGYFDQATKATLRNIHNGMGPEESGSFSDDLAGASRIAPLVLRYADDPEALDEAVTAQTRMTHNNPIVIQSGLFFGRTARAVLHGAPPAGAMEQEAGRFPDTPIPKWVREGIDAKNTETLEAVLGFGQTCHTEQAFPAVVHLLARYEGDLKEALVESVMAGGDSAGRNLIVGMILGAHLGMPAVPEDWITGMQQAEAIGQLLDRLS